MRRLLPLCTVLLALATLAPRAARADLILSELCDPHLNYTTDRFIEIYNSGPGAIDLTNWAVVAVANGVEVTTWTLSGSIPEGTAKVCGSTTATTFTVDFPSAVWATTTGYMNWNGRIGDGARLKQNGVVVDQIVATGTLFENEDLVRNSNIAIPNATGAEAEWTATPVELATDASPGSHNGSLPPPTGPKITDIATIPLSPAADEAVNIAASIVDTAGAIASAHVDWGFSSGSLTSTIAMSNVSDSSWVTVSTIPGQPAGTVVYYQIQATGPALTNQTAVRSYTIPGTLGAPLILAVGETSDSTLLVTFSEPVEETTAETTGNYTIGVLVPVSAVHDPVKTAEVTLTVRNLTPGALTLTVTGVQDLDGFATNGATKGFTYVDVTIPPGYYDGTAGLIGSALRAALHDIIKNHTVKSYDYALTAFATTDVKPNGKIWDMYSDVPGGTPPYEYNVGETGQGATEGLGYNREHSFPQSWFNGLSPMYSDLNHLYPADAKVNGYRANYPYGDVGVATTTSLNGSQVGNCVDAGYTGTVFEPIDAYKGDLARGQFYMATRYFTEDAGWAGSPSFTGATPTPWATQTYVAWSAADPVSWKERLRNGAVYSIQNNRNPFIDHPEFVAMIFDSSSVTAVEPVAIQTLRMAPASPNPFSARTVIGFDLPRAATVTLAVFDIGGRRVRTLVPATRLEPGSHTAEWNGRDEAGEVVRPGLYFCRLDTGDATRTTRLVHTR